MPRIDASRLNLEETVVQVARVAKVVMGGRRFSFRALVVVGDRAGHVGVGLGKATEVPEAIRKGTEDAKKRLIRVPMMGTTIPFAVTGRFDRASEVMLKPAAPGTSVIAGGVGARAVVEAAGIRDILTKSLGSSNALNTVMATMEALRDLKNFDAEAARRGKSVRTSSARSARRRSPRRPLRLPRCRSSASRARTAAASAPVTGAVSAVDVDAVVIAARVARAATVAALVGVRAAAIALVVPPAVANRDA